MTLSKLATALLVIFIVFVVALAGELFYVLWRHRSFRRRSSPIHDHDETTPNSSITDAATKELLYFFCLKPHTPVEVSPAGAPNKDNDTSSPPDDQVIDVFKLLDAKGPSRFLCTIKEEEKEEMESKPDVDFSNKPTPKIVCLQSRVQLAKKALTAAEAKAEEVVAVTVDQDDSDGNTKTVFSTPCDSPMFFTPVGSPCRDFVESDFVVSVHETVNGDDDR